MKKAKHRLPGVIAWALVLAMAMTAASTIVSAAGVNVVTAAVPGQSIHGKVAVNEITGDVAEPPMLTGAASAVGVEKAWYEYVYYAPDPVGYYYLNDTTRVSFYDPYDYADALIMEVEDTITDWSSNNSMQVSYTTGNSLTVTNGRTTEASTSVLEGYTDVETTTTGPHTVTTTVKNQTDNYNTSKTVQRDGSVHHSNTFSTALNIWAEVDFAPEGMGGKAGDSDTFTDTDSTSWVTGDVETFSVSLDPKGRVGYSKSENTTTVDTGAITTTVTNTIADRVTRATGSSNNTSIVLSEQNSTTVTKTYDAGYFNASGAPLQWKIVKYTVKMPMKFQVEYLVDDEWIFGDYSYCLLNTVQGTCRSWLQNNTAYYEHWGTGEAVTWDEFWSQFFTPDSLVQAYRNRLYPDY